MRAETRILLVDTATMYVNEKLKLANHNELDFQHSSITRPGDACQGVGVGQTRVVQGRMDPGPLFVCFGANRMVAQAGERLTDIGRLHTTWSCCTTRNVMQECVCGVMEAVPGV